MSALVASSPALVEETGQDVPVIDEYASMELATGIDGDGVVHAGVANDAIPKAKPTESEATEAQDVLNEDTIDPIQEMEQRMAHVTRLVAKVGDSWAPWKIKKNKSRSSQAVADLDGLRTVMLQQLETIARLQNECMEHNAIRTHSQAQAETITRMKAQISELQESKVAKAVEVSSMLSKVESVAPGPKRYLKLDATKESELLQSRVDGLVKEHEKLKAENDKLAHSKMELAKRLKEVTDKHRDDNEIKEREMRRVSAEIKRANDAKEAAVAAARAEAAEQLAARAREIKNTQKRMETMKSELEVFKGREQSVKKDAEVASTATTKAQADVKAAARKAADARAEKEEMAQQLALARDEMATVAAEYSQVAKLCKDLGAKTLPGFSAIRADGAVWPRQAFTVRGSCVLHSCACGKVDVTKLEVREYNNARQLEGWLAEGLVLCRECKASGF